MNGATDDDFKEDESKIRMGKGPTNIADKTFPGQVVFKNHMPSRMSCLSISTHNGLILVAEPLQSQVQETKDKRTITKQNILNTVSLSK